ncbi:MAG: protein kinase domain-containing protein, partial [Bacteroidales bacterium]
IQFFNMKKALVINWKSILQNSGAVAIKKMLDPTLKTYLQLLHDNGIVHNDVKEDNIMMGLEGTLRLVDFGQSQMNCSFW